MRAKAIMTIIKPTLYTIQVRYANVKTMQKKSSNCPPVSVVFIGLFGWVDGDLVAWGLSKGCEFIDLVGWDWTAQKSGH
jgi:hypothetical protein